MDGVLDAEAYRAWWFDGFSSSKIPVSFSLLCTNIIIQAIRSFSGS